MAVDIERQLRERYGDEVCATRIAENVSLAESPARNQDVFEHAPTSRGAQNYADLLDELVAAGFMHAAVSKTRPAVRTAPPGARTALATEQGGFCAAPGCLQSEAGAHAAYGHLTVCLRVGAGTTRSALFVLLADQ